MSKTSRYPFPVYVATFPNDETARLSFWSPQGKPFDFERGRRAVAACWSRPEGARGFATTYPPRPIIDGHVEWNGERHDDPYFHAVVALPKAKPQNWRKVAQEALAALKRGADTRAIDVLEAAFANGAAQ
jgi:hypothetical protein